MCIWVVGFEVWGLGLSIEGEGLRVCSLGCSVKG